MKKFLVKIYEKARKHSLFFKRYLVKPTLPNNADGKVYINLGCGLNSSKRYINVDVLPFPNIHFIRDINDLQIFPDKYADLIYASHVLEHIPRHKLRATLLEWRRVLKSGGVLRLSVPDFDALVQHYINVGKDVDVVRDNILGQEPPYNNHYTLWNFSKAATVLASVGFDKVRLWSPDEVGDHDFQDRSSRLLPIEGGFVPLSLNVEGVKSDDL